MTRFLWTLGAVFGMAMFTFSSSAFAQEEEEDSVPVTSYDFDDDLVTGDLVRPDGEIIQVSNRGRRSSLIQIREHFINEMLKSIEDL